MRSIFIRDRTDFKNVVMISIPLVQGITTALSLLPYQPLIQLIPVEPVLKKPNHDTR